MKMKYLTLCFIFILAILLTGCKSSDYEEALNLESSEEYDSALEIFESLEDYKDSSSHVTLCKDMISAIKEFDSAKSELEVKNKELESAVQSAQELLQEDKPTLDETLPTSLETAISETTAAKIEIPDLPDTADEIIALSRKLRQVNYEEEMVTLSDAKVAFETSVTQYSLVDNPSESYIINCLELVPTVDDISAATEKKDPNSQLNKAGGYTADVFFSSNLIDQSEVEGKTLINKGTAAGGSIEVYTTIEDAKKRDSYLSTFDGTVLATGSHTIVGTVLVRTSDNLTASEQKKLEAWIITCLTAVPDDVGRAIQFGNYTISLQDYWKENQSDLSTDNYNFYAETDGKIAAIYISYISDDENTVSLDSLHEENDSIISAFESRSGDDAWKVDDYQDFQSDEDVTGVLYKCENKNSVLSYKCYVFIYPSETDNIYFGIILFAPDNTDKDYTDDFMKIISSIKKVPTSK